MSRDRGVRKQGRKGVRKQGSELEDSLPISDNQIRFAVAVHHRTTAFGVGVRRDKLHKQKETLHENHDTLAIDLMKAWPVDLGSTEFEVGGHFRLWVIRKEKKFSLCQPKLCSQITIEKHKGPLCLLIVIWLQRPGSHDASWQEARFAKSHPRPRLLALRNLRCGGRNVR